MYNTTKQEWTDYIVHQGGNEANRHRVPGSMVPVFRAESLASQIDRIQC